MGGLTGSDFASHPVQFFGIFFTEFRKIGWFHKMVFETVEDDLFQLVAPDGVCVVTGAFVTPVGTGEMGFAEHAETAAAGPTLEKSGE
nr:hypothetical protein [Emcibacter nanhaiensis]